MNFQKYFRYFEKFIRLTKKIQKILNKDEDKSSII
jgi:hypothetical protein